MPMEGMPNIVSKDLQQVEMPNGFTNLTEQETRDFSRLEEAIGSFDFYKEYDGNISVPIFKKIQAGYNQKEQGKMLKNLVDRVESFSPTLILSLEKSEYIQRSLDLIESILSQEEFLKDKKEKNIYYKEAINKIFSVLLEKESLFNDLLDSKDEETRIKTLNIIDKALSFSKRNNEENIFNILFKVLKNSDFNKKIEKEGGFNEFNNTKKEQSKLLALLYTHNDLDSREKLIPLVSSLFEQENELGEGIIDELIEKIINEYVNGIKNKKSNKEEERIFWKLFKEIFSKYNLSAPSFMDAWDAVTEYENFGQISRRNISMVRDIEKKKSGGVKILNEEYGIYNFIRYPENLLIKQLENENIQNPYGIIVYPYSDHNGVFNGEHHGDYMMNFGEELEKEGCSVRIIETRSRIDFIKKLVSLDNKYGEENKIYFSIIGGHGDERSLQFGNTNEKEQITDKDIINASPRFSKFFKPDAPFILDSCCVGKKNGFASKLSKLFGVNHEVIASDEAINGIKNIKITKKEGGLSFNVVFKNNEYTNKNSLVYKSGQKV